MSFLSTLGRMLVPTPEGRRELSIQTSPEFDMLPIEEQIARLRRQIPVRSYRLPSVEEALGVPAILSAVNLISSTVGSLSLEVFQNGTLLSDPFRVPRLTQRPNPLGKPYDFWRDTAWYLATRGEFWWWVAARDGDGLALALYPVPPWEIRVEENRRNRLRPRIFWGDAEIRNDDIIAHRYLPDDEHPHRGKGPLQRSGAAVSVAVEADAWAGNFFSGSLPSVVGSTEEDLGEDDLLVFDRQWLEKDNNLPRWMTNGMKLAEPPYNAEKAQLTESRQHQVGEVARMFNLPGSLLEYNMPGASLRYQNDEQIWTDFQRRCLSPSYLEPMEQAISDLLVRSMAARFNLGQLLRSDSKTRAEIYEKLVPLNIITAEEARQEEGKAPGNVNFAPVPAAQPAAIVNRLPPTDLSRELSEVRCPSCDRVAGEFAGAYRTKCKKCGTMVTGDVQRTLATESPTAADRLAEVAMELARREAPAPPEPQPAAVDPRLLAALAAIAEREAQPPAHITVSPEIILPSEMTVKAEPVQMIAPESVPQMLSEELVARLERALAPKEREVIRDEGGHIIRIKEVA